MPLMSGWGDITLIFRLSAMQMMPWFIVNQGRKAQRLKDAIGARLLECGLELHPDKTKIVYCQDSNRRRGYADVKFDFLGFGFQPRQSKSRWGILFLNFSPAISAKVCQIRSWKIHRWTHLSIEELAASINPILRGWINYYGQYYKSLLTPVLGQSITLWCVGGETEIQKVEGEP